MFCYFTKDGFKVVHYNILDDNKAYVHADGTYYCGTYVIANVMIKDGCSYVDVFKRLGVNNESFKACFKNELKNIDYVL